MTDFYRAVSAAVVADIGIPLDSRASAALRRGSGETSEAGEPSEAAALRSGDQARPAPAVFFVESACLWLVVNIDANPIQFSGSSPRISLAPGIIFEFWEFSLLLRLLLCIPGGSIQQAGEDCIVII